MSKDIRSYFNTVPKKSSTNGSINKPTVNKFKKSTIIIDSDSDDDIVKETPEKPKPKSIASKLKSKQPEKKEKLIPINIEDVFGDKPIKQSKVKTPPPSPKPSTSTSKEKNDKESSKSKKNSKKNNPELEVHKDNDFEKTLDELDDDDLILENIDILDKTLDEASHKEEKEKSHKDEAKVEKGKKEADGKEKGVKRQRKNSDVSTPKKQKLEHTDSGIDPDQEAFEKKRYSAILYQQYKNRGGPKHHGEKEIPKGKPNCLSNLTFLRTGVLDSLEKEEFENLIKQHGGRVVGSVSKKVNYLVVGDEPGPSKLQKARDLHIQEIDENELLDMILVKSGLKPKFSKNSTDESGIIADYDKQSPKKDKSKEGTPKKDKSKTKRSLDLTESDDDSKSKAPRISKESNVRLKGESPVKRDKVKHKLDNETTSKTKRESPEERKAEKKQKSDIDIITKEIDNTFKGKQTTMLVKDLEQDTTCLSWTEKYKPKDSKSIIGQQDASSNLNKLQKWLKNWYLNQQPERKKKIPKPSPWAKNDDGAYFKAALLSGPPGVGKTTTATLVSQELGYDIVEFNASDTRSKKLLHEEVAQLLGTTTLAGFAKGQEKTTNKKRVLLMDEVDGMAGNEDRGGISELINLIKNTNVPIICMCNDRNHQKMRTLVNYCFDLRFSNPKMEQIRGAMMSICFKEGVNISPVALGEIIRGTGCDVRQTLNNISMFTIANKKLSDEVASKESKLAIKDTTSMGPWEVIKKVFSESEHKSTSIADRAKLFFYDYSLGPLFVQENYLNVTPKCTSKDIMKRVALAADAISRGDLMDAKIRSTNNWSLLDCQAYFASVLPGYYMSGNVTKRINFPAWLGKNSAASKKKRMLNELHIHTRTKTSGSRLAMGMDYVVPLRDAIIEPLRKYQMEGIHMAVEVMKSYNLLREDLDNLLELCYWKGMRKPFDDVESKVKAAFTRAYNKEVALLPYAPTAGISKKKSSALDDEFNDEDESQDEENDDVKADSLIKVKAKDKKESGMQKNKTAKQSKASTSKKGKK